MRRYSVASGRTSSGVDMRRSRFGAMISPSVSTMQPERKAVRTLVWTASLIFSFSPRPMRDAMTTFVPRERPENRLTRRLMRAALLPTAAIAVEESKRPTTARSAELNSCCRMLARASGRAKRTIFPARGPCSISI